MCEKVGGGLWGMGGGDSYVASWAVFYFSGSQQLVLMTQFSAVLICTVEFCYPLCLCIKLLSI